MDGIDGGCSSPSPPGVPNFNSGSCGDECVEAAVNYDEAACKATNDILPDPSGDAGSFSSWWWPVSSNKGGESGVLWKGLLAWAVVSVICFAIFGADAAGKCSVAMRVDRASAAARRESRLVARRPRVILRRRGAAGHRTRSGGGEAGAPPSMRGRRGAAGHRTRSYLQYELMN